MQEVFNGTPIKKTAGKSTDVIGREWTENEKNEYYKNFKTNYSDWKNEVLKLLYENKILYYKNNIDDSRELDKSMIAAFNNNIQPSVFILNFVNKK